MPMSRVAWILTVGLVAGLAAGCGDASGPESLVPPDDMVLPAPDTSLDPDRLALGDVIATPCTWGINDPFKTLRDRHEWAFVDIYFGRGSEAGPWDGPTDDDIALVEASGGFVLFRFHVPAVRAVIMLSHVPDVVLGGYWIIVRDVPDPARYDVMLSVGLDHEWTDQDIQRFQELGGRIDYRFSFIPAISGVLPDRSIPALWDHPGVRYIEPESVACLTL